MFSKHNGEEASVPFTTLRNGRFSTQPLFFLSMKTADGRSKRVHVTRSAASKGKYLSSRVRKTHNPPPPRKREPWLPRKLSRNAVRTLRLCAKLVPQREGQIHKHHHRAHVSMSPKAIIENAIPNRPTRRTNCRTRKISQTEFPRTGELTEERQPSY